MQIEVKSLIDTEFLVSSEQGEKVFPIVREIFDKEGEVLELSFKGVRNALTVFLNTMYGRLFKDFPPELIHSKIFFTNITDRMKVQLEYVESNAIRYYENPQIYNEVEDEYIAQFE